MNMNNTPEHVKFAMQLMHKYAYENQIPARSTSDLSPFEQWLIFEYFRHVKYSCPECGSSRILEAKDYTQCRMCWNLWK